MSSNTCCKGKEKQKPQEFTCYNTEGAAFQAPLDDVFQYNWWEIFCYPYMLCARFWECCIALCSGTNQCLIYCMIVQWVMCKCSRLTTPDPIFFPYYFYMIFQVLSLILFFVYIWSLFGKSVLLPFFRTYYAAIFGLQSPGEFIDKNNRTSSVSFRRFCFRKGDIFSSPEVPLHETSFAPVYYPNYYIMTLMVLVDLLVYKLFA